ncbi:MAG: HTH domain-containing protein [Candidatus Bathyarchaeota archaeon]|nr:MAG: HTH domain-containing protein [Candidatus Bathyarchaeota archaeon]
MGKLDRPVLELLKASAEPLSLSEIASNLGAQEKAVYRTLKRLFEKGKINSKARKYSIETKDT